MEESTDCNTVFFGRLPKEVLGKVDACWHTFEET
jgi:hypothetical protein